MPYKRMLIILVICLMVAALLQYLLVYSAEAVSVYAGGVFEPLQVSRNFLLGWQPISIGDLLYIAAVVFIIFLIVKGIRKLLKKQVNKRGLLTTLLKAVMAVGVVYIWFFVGWGGNYHKPTLSAYWGLNDDTARMDDSVLIAFDKYLIGKLNEYAPTARYEGFRETEKKAKKYYGQFAATKDKVRSLNIKSSLFGDMLEYSGVQGYYNPFTGEGQVNSRMPDFMQPFIICHEMAHQAGIAAEDDANLLGFIIGRESNDPAFVYSCYFNIWLYTNSELRSRDSVLAKDLRDGLNEITQGQIRELRERRKKFRSPLSRVSNIFYDNYLKLHQQEKGMDSYDDVVMSAWVWEERHPSGAPEEEGVPRSIP